MSEVHGDVKMTVSRVRKHAGAVIEPAVFSRSLFRALKRAGVVVPEAQT